MEPIDKAAEAFARIVSDIGDYRSSIISEQDTRMKVIDLILIDVLGWPRAEIHAEEPSGRGYIDYKLTVNGLARLVVEAKRDARDFDLDHRSAGRAYKLCGPVFQGSDVKEGIEQAIRYCGQKNAELACVSNGREWVVFRGSRLGDGRDTMDGMAFVFPSLDAIGSKFALFYDLLCYEAVTDFRYRAYFQEAEGRAIRTHGFRRAVRSPESRRLLPRDTLSTHLERVMSSFFRRLSGDDDPELLMKCFVVTRESHAADERLARISEDLAARIRDIDTDSGEQLKELVERVRSTQRNEFVILVGTKGAGKSTFIDRFFSYILPLHLRRECIVARVDLRDSKGDEAGIVTWLDQRLLETLESAVFGDEAPSFDDLQGMFFDEYKRRKAGTLRYLYERDKDAFKIDFGQHVERRREERPHEYIQRLVSHVVRVRRKIPCLIFDNADHFTIEFQERVFQYARSIYESEICLVILPITDRTSWQLSRDGALRSFENESLFLPTPAPNTVLRKRVEFLEERLADERREPGKGYFLARGIHLSIDNLTAFTAALQAIFLTSGDPAWWIGNLANNDIRQCLEIAKGVVTSPHLEVHELVSTYVAGSNLHVPSYKVKRALIKGSYDIFPGELNPPVRNIYAMDDETEATPLLGLRLLRLLQDAQESDVDETFVTLEQVIEYCRAMLIDPLVTTAWLRHMLEAGLCLSYDPTVTDIRHAGRIEVSPAGLQHLRWGTRDHDYAQAMLEVTPLVDRVAFDQLTSLMKRPHSDVWRIKLDHFVSYLISEDAKHCRIPDHEAYVTQKQLASELRRMIADE